MTVCVLDSDPAEIEAVAEQIHGSGYQALTTGDPEKALELIRTERCQVVVAGMHMPGADGCEFLYRALSCDPTVRVIVLAAQYDRESALEAIRCGATDFLPKPVDGVRLKRSLDEIAALRDRERRVGALEEQLLNDFEFHGLIGKSPAMLEVFDFARRAAPHYSHLLIIGPPGSGRELLARAIHEISPVSRQPLAVCNCSALAGPPAERKLFGCARGAYAGATDARPGLFEYANGGAVFLDDVGNTSPAIQVRLLRLLENGEIQRAGSNEVRPVRVRLIAATSRDLQAEALAGRFSKELYERIRSPQIRIPSLAERAEDIPLLVPYLLKKYNAAFGKTISGATRRARIALQQHSWPGNVRELENVISTACILATRPFLDIGDLPEHFQQSAAAPDGSNAGKPLALDDVRKEHIRTVLELCRGNRMRAAQILGIGRTSLYRYLKRNAGKPGAHERSRSAAARVF